jgi:hypothetical protein
MEKNILSAIGARVRQNEPAMPFQKGIRVACPAKHFELRHTQHCLDCPYFAGIFMREFLGTMEGEDAQKAAKLNAILCSHIISRSLRYFPED